MKSEIRILLVEDNDADADLVCHAMRKAGITFTVVRVETQSAFTRELAKPLPDLILADFSLPAFDGYTALAIAQQKCPDVPFIFVTGTLGEEVAIETLKQGATDYVLKHRLSRLAPSIHRALREGTHRVKRKQAEEQLRQSHEQLRSLSIYLQEVREDERIRIAREVHDELGQALTALKLELTWLNRRLPENPKNLREKARGMAMHIDEIIHDVRRIATELRPGVLDNAGLLAAIEWQAAGFERQTGITCHVKSSLKETPWDQDINTVFFRIFQETLTNIIRHAAATKVDVRLAEQNGQLILAVKDNGRGISENEIHNTKSIGLLGMRERAALLGGEVRVRGTAGRGTTVSVSIPRPPAPGKLRSHENSNHRRPRLGTPRLEAHLG